MSRASTTYNKFFPALASLTCEGVKDDDRRKLARICRDPSFTREMERLAGIYPLFYKREPTDRDVLGTLDDLKRTADVLHKKISGLPLRINGLLLLPGDHATEPDCRFELAQLLVALARLSDFLIPRAAARVKPKAGTRFNVLGRAAAAKVREVFKEHGVRPTTANLTFCLQLALGTPDARVDRLLK